MPRVGKAKRLRRYWRRVYRARDAAHYRELQESFVAFMRERGIAGTVSADHRGVTIVGGTDWAAAESDPVTDIRAALGESQ